MVERGIGSDAGQLCGGTYTPAMTRVRTSVTREPARHAASPYSGLNAAIRTALRSILSFMDQSSTGQSVDGPWRRPRSSARVPESRVWVRSLVRYGFTTACVA